MKRQMLFAKELEVEGDVENSKICIQYNLTETNGLEKDKLYGIEIVKKHDNLLEKDMVANLSYSKKNVEEIIAYLAENLVTPVSLVYILDDLA